MKCRAISETLNRTNAVEEHLANVHTATIGEDQASVAARYVRFSGDGHFLILLEPATIKVIDAHTFAHFLANYLAELKRR